MGYDPACCWGTIGGWDGEDEDIAAPSSRHCCVTKLLTAQVAQPKPPRLVLHADLTLGRLFAYPAGAEHAVHVWWHMRLRVRGLGLILDSMTASGTQDAQRGGAAPRLPV
jgi:hypothetical protein